MPKDIGFIEKDMQVLFQIDAFDYNIWGISKGQVTEIASDFLIINHRPVFKVKSKLNQPYLKLKNGYTGYLKKGMTLRARFTITERSLWQLLYDKADSWMNPMRKGID